MNKPIGAVHAGIVAAYRRGLGLAAVVVLTEAAGVRIAAIGPEDSATAALAPAARWWCRRRAEAARVAEVAMRRFRRESTLPSDQSAQTDAPRLENPPNDVIARACESIAGAARDLHVALYTDEEIADAAMAAAARVDSEIERMQRAGELKSVNKSYQTYRIEASARGERVMRYQDWMRKYKENLMCQLAATLRDL